MLRIKKIRVRIIVTLRRFASNCDEKHSTLCNNPLSVVLRQSLGDQNVQDYTYCPKTQRALRRMETNRTMKQILKTNSSHIASYFLPKGYPHSVSAGYDAFVRGQMIAMTLSTASGVLSMQCMLFAIGLGAGSLPLAATLNWVIKDGLGQLGGVIFAGMVNNQFDADPKKWRMLAALSMDLSSFIELLTPLFPGYFLPLAAVANVGKNISFLAASATRATIHKSFAAHENLADVTAKTGSQCILASLLGTSFGLSLAAAFGGNQSAIVAAFLGCSALNLFATYGSLKKVTLTTLSLGRLDFIVDHHLNSSSDSAAVRLYQPIDVMAREKYLGAPCTGLVPVQVGVDIDSAISDLSPSELTTLLDWHKGRGYILNCYSMGESGKNGVGRVVMLVEENATRKQLLTGLVHSLLIRRKMRDESRTSFQFRLPHSSVLPSSITPDWVWRKDLLQSSLKQESLVSAIVNALLTTEKSATADSSADSVHSCGWLIEELMLESRLARVSLIYGGDESEKVIK